MMKQSKQLQDSLLVETGKVLVETEKHKSLLAELATLKSQKDNLTEMVEIMKKERAEYTEVASKQEKELMKLRTTHDDNLQVLEKLRTSLAQESLARSHAEKDKQAIVDQLNDKVDIIKSLQEELRTTKETAASELSKYDSMLTA